QSFTADDPEEKSTKVQIDSIQVKEAGDLILIRIIGSHFIWKMVRQLVGVMAEVGRGDLPLNDVKRFLHEHSDVPAKYTAPPSGLFLERVYYKDDMRVHNLRPVMEISGGKKEQLHSQQYEARKQEESHKNPKTRR
ncbi:MAG TPA: hypothetical protein VMU30_10890, partial [Bacteroidota bacterium]|nr:hypothetical protein [Bacteroidota bacterium]